MFSDASISHYPDTLFLQRSLAQGQVPLWSPNILSGYPFAADPLSGLWYPLGWLALLFPLPFGLNLTVLLHLVLGGAGMFLLLRAQGRSPRAALFGGVAFELLPRLFAHYGAGHLTMLYAITLLPWLLLAELRREAGQGAFWTWQPGVLLALIALAYPPWALYAGLLWLAFLLSNPAEPWRRKLGQASAHALAAVALAAPSLLPLLEYSRLSTRAQLSPSDVLAYSLPFSGLAGLLAPQFGQFHEWVLYPGVIVLILAIFAVSVRGKDRIRKIWLLTAVIAVVYSLGSYIPGLQFLAGLPGFAWLRVPPRVLALAGLALVALAAAGLDELLSRTGQTNLRRLQLVWVALMAVQVELSLAAALSGGNWLEPLWGLAFSSAFMLVLSFWLRQPQKAKWTFAALLALLVLDLGAMDASLLSFHPKQEVLAQGAEAAQYLARQPGQFRVYSPSYSIPQQTAAASGLELADGVDPLQLQAYAEFMQGATGVPETGYSVSLPPFENGDPPTANRDSQPDAEKLGLLNVGFIASEFPLSSEGFQLSAKFGGTYVYKVLDPLPRASMDGNAETVRVLEWTPNRIRLLAHGPGKLILSEINYPGWSAQVDGKPVEIQPYQGILRCVELADGEHEVVFRFVPKTVEFGLGFSLIALLGLTVWRRTER